MLNTKEKIILQYLYQHRGDYSTSKVLADYLSFSDRTIRTYIKKLSTDLPVEDTGFTIVSKQGYGYQLEVLDDDTYHHFLVKNNLAVGMDYGDIDNRHKAILNKLIFKEETVLFDDLADQLFVSRSTLSSDFKKIRSQLAKYQLSIESKPYRGVYVLGDEQDKRHFIMDYFFGEHFHQNMSNFVGKDILDIPLSMEELTIIVLDECRNQELKLSDYAIQNLVIHLALAIQRFQKGFRIAPVELCECKYQKELLVARNIADRLANRLGQEELIPEEETAYIALHLISKSVAEQDPEANLLNLRQELITALDNCDTSQGYDFSSDMALIEGLLMHLEVLLERLVNNIHLDNPLLEDIQKRYGDVLKLTENFLGDLPTFQKYYLSQDEIAYVSLHFMASIERQKEKHKLTVLVICATGFGSAQMLKNRITNELGQLVTISDVIGYYDLDNDKLKDVDAIMSTIDLSNLVFNIPVLTVSVFLSDQEIQEAKQTFSKIQGKQRRRNITARDLSLDTAASAFKHYFSEENFLVLENASKAEVMEEMIRRLVPDDSDHQKELADLIRGRERLSTLVFDQEIAVPHPLKPISEKHQIAVAVVKNGVYWEDGFEKIKLIFLVAPSVYTNEGLKPITNRIVDLVDLPEVKEQLINTEDFESFKSIFLDQRRQ
ncbi:BglG family transcription antiterminator [Streptococcus dysgalactiae]|uniref:Transcriptional antiterminator bglG n=1 Tax=Streptococcus dysgalactiae subsp. equisimilis TaxID=119602 RepID=A0A9X8T1W6_STREQ|nr:BglG family transcription antiterminator [Streptococcus dysgalactiae]BAH81895.1 transcriptional antiterminator bglG [Streptococcus dysgalactiae subsp. equisimilis GGS_124]SUN62365.1 transcriptional antiterminator bglG [Streptococcus dysgalactiae subsp. equisimilis]VTS34767.1 transcriptional antiterminator bglG [Streptococcus dysgalactiae subsp. equisimilis]VTT06442.1 transcriptional antiterminator bglG [Streptococcus dysgalactiae subsp. equisimilis]